MAATIGELRRSRCSLPSPVPRAEAVRDAESETGLALEPAFAEVFTFTMGTLTPQEMGKRTCNPNRLF